MYHLMVKGVHVLFRVRFFGREHTPWVRRVRGVSRVLSVGRESRSGVLISGKRFDLQTLILVQIRSDIRKTPTTMKNYNGKKKKKNYSFVSGFSIIRPLRFGRTEIWGTTLGCGGTMGTAEGPPTPTVPTPPPIPGLPDSVF